MNGIIWYSRNLIVINQVLSKANYRNLLLMIEGEKNMSGFDTIPYKINDFLEWNERKQLVLSPKFQRRSVWKDVAKSFLIDSIIRQKPLPKIFIRELTDIKTRTTRREVVDGQQRLRTILDFINDGFKVKHVHNSEYGETYFSNLPENIQSRILQYKCSVDVLQEVDDGEIMDIFARLNTYTTPLNPQELINAKYYGYFKQLVYSLSYKYNQFWVNNKIFTEYQTMRMIEVEMTADLIIAAMDGIQNRKIVDMYYKKYDDEFEDRKIYETRFDEIISLIVDIFDDGLKTSKFRKPALFYSLFLAIYNLKYEIKGYESLKLNNINEKQISKMNSILDQIEIFTESDDLSKEEGAFVTSISRATSDALSRKTRTSFIIDKLNEVLR